MVRNDLSSYVKSLRTFLKIYQPWFFNMFHAQDWKHNGDGRKTDQSKQTDEIAKYQNFVYDKWII